MLKPARFDPVALRLLPLNSQWPLIRAQKFAILQIETCVSETTVSINGEMSREIFRPRARIGSFA